MTIARFFLEKARKLAAGHATPSDTKEMFWMPLTKRFQSFLEAVLCGHFFLDGLGLFDFGIDGSFPSLGRGSAVSSQGVFVAVELEANGVGSRSLDIFKVRLVGLALHAEPGVNDYQSENTLR